MEIVMGDVLMVALTLGVGATLIGALIKNWFPALVVIVIMLVGHFSSH